MLLWSAQVERSFCCRAVLCFHAMRLEWCMAVVLGWQLGLHEYQLVVPSAGQQVLAGGHISVKSAAQSAVKWSEQQRQR